MTEKKEEKKMNFNLPKSFNLMHLSAAVFICILLGALIGMALTPKPIETTPIVVSIPTDEEITAKTVKYINENLLTEGMTVNATKVEKTGDSLYLVSFELFEGTEKVQEGELYITADLKMLLLGQVLDMSVPLPKPEETEPPVQAEVQKKDKPVIELFVMSHCPYGTQMEKGILPVYEALKDKADFQLKYVYYAMHGKTELDEQTLQRAIELQYGEEKLWNYLTEFLKDGNTENALTAVELKKEDLTDKIAELDTQFNVTAEFENKDNWLSGYYPLFNLDKEANTAYAIGGSPSLVINGVSVSSARNPAALLETICSSFTVEPEECSTLELSSANPSAGFGFEETNSTTTATCG
ncbi:MAG: hypothetical protein JW703_04190 [Candidatus Diapherotrites archaeon]|nr:hypothetical protein [Candidatus Diapherotrites archaeon]